MDPSDLWTEGTSVLLGTFCLILVVSLIKSLQSFLFSRLRHTPTCQIIRSGFTKVKPVTKILVGDIIVLEAGQPVPVDSLVVSSSELKIENTGDFEPESKEQNDFIIHGSFVASGHASVVALDTFRKWSKETNLQKRLIGLTQRQGLVGIVGAFSVFAILIVFFILEGINSGNWNWAQLISIFLISFAIVFVAVPEGLPLTLSLNLAFSVFRLKKLGCWVRNLSALETMGQISSISIGKTGVVTEKTMSVATVYAQDKLHEQFGKKSVEKRTLELLVDCIYWTDSNESLIEFIKSMGINLKKKKNNSVKKSEEVHDHQKVVQVESSDGKSYQVIRGASELVLESCTLYINSEGDSEYLDSDKRAYISQEVIQHLGERSQKTIAFAYTEGSETVLVSIIGLENPLKEFSADVIHECHRAGVIVRMVTSDNRDTAIAVARKSFILPRKYNHTYGDDTVMTGIEFRNKAKSQNLSTMVKKLRVLARASSEDRKLLIKGLKELNEVVADSKLTHNADIVFGRDLFFKDFSAVVYPIVWGRNLYESIRKFLVFHVTVSIVTLVTCLIGASALEELPFTPLKLLWVNLMVDSFAALALATEKPESKILRGRPIKKEQSLVTPDMIKLILGQTLYQIGALTVCMFFTEEFLEGCDQPGVFFRSFVYLQIFNLINCRKIKSQELNVFKGIFRNFWFIVVVLIIVAVQEGIFDWAATDNITWEGRGVCVLIGFGGLLVGFAFRMLSTSIVVCHRIREDRVGTQQADTSIVSIMRTRTSRSLRSFTRGFYH